MCRTDPYSLFLISVLQTLTADLGSDPVNSKDVDALCSRFLHAGGGGGGCRVHFRQKHCDSLVTVFTNVDVM